MVGLDLETYEEREHRGTEGAPGQPSLLLERGVVGIDQCGEHPGQEGYGLHLGIMAHLDYLQVVGAEGHGHGAADRHQRMHSEGEHQQPGAQHRDEQVGRRSAPGEQEIVDLLGPVAVGGRVDGGGGHAAEHGFRPGGGIVGMGSVPVHHLLRHALPARDVALVDYLAVEHLRHVGIGQDKHSENGAQIKQYLLSHNNSSSLPVSTRREYFSISLF